MYPRIYSNLQYPQQYRPTKTVRRIWECSCLKNPSFVPLLCWTWNTSINRSSTTENFQVGLLVSKWYYSFSSATTPFQNGTFGFAIYLFFKGQHKRGTRDNSSLFFGLTASSVIQNDKFLFFSATASPVAHGVQISKG